MTSGFYRRQAESFSGTRQAPWAGWERMAGIVFADGPDAGPDDGRALSVLDVACGNLRFEAFLGRRLPGRGLTCHAVDSCDALVDAAAVPVGRTRIIRHRVDVIARLLDGDPPLSPAPPCDLTACFGFFHHVPGAALREELFGALVDATAPGGHVALSFWRFMESADLAARARESHRRGLELLSSRRGFDAGSLDAGDYLLGWQGRPGEFRYCHSFSTREVDALAASVADRTHVAARFEADGRTGNLNSYLVLRVTR